MSPISVEKTLGMLAMPASLVWLLILALAWLCLRRRQWAPGALALAAALLYAALGNIYLAEAAADTLERQVPRCRWTGCPPSTRSGCWEAAPTRTGPAGPS